MAAAAEIVPSLPTGALLDAGFLSSSAPWNPTLPMLDVKIAIHNRIQERVSVERLSDLSGERTRADLRGLVRSLVSEEIRGSEAQVDQLTEEILGEVLGLGPIEPLMEDATVSDILVTTKDMIYVERAGRLQETAARFKNDDHLLRVIERIVSRVGRRIDESNPLVDARLPDGSRVNAVIPPVAVDGPLLSIRRFGRVPLSADVLVQNLSLTEGMLEVLKSCVQARLNILVSGGTGAGKTTLLNILSGSIPETERIVTIEDAAELRLRQRHVARLESRPSNVDGDGAIRIRQLVINALRMRPDRIVVGEVRGEEALDMLQAMNTGHDGSLTTIHANTPRDALSRLEVMVGMANNNLPVRAIRQQMASAINVIVQIARMGDGARRVTYISECCGMEGENVTLQDLFVFEKTGLGENGRVKGRFRSTGIRPRFSERLQAAGITMAPALFQTVLEIR